MLFGSVSFRTDKSNIDIAMKVPAGQPKYLLKQNHMVYYRSMFGPNYTHWFKTIAFCRIINVGSCCAANI